MKMFIKEIQKSQYTNKAGLQKYTVYDGDGEKHSTTDERLNDHIGQEVDVLEETGIYNNVPWSKITLNEFGGKRVVETPRVEEKVDWSAKERRMVRMHTQKVAGEQVSTYMSSLGGLEDWAKTNPESKQTREELLKDMSNLIIAVSHELEEDIYRED